MKKTIITLALAAIFGATIASAQGPWNRGADRHAARELDQAIKLMNNALPIYDGKRAEADDLCRLARREIFEATHPNAPDSDRYHKLRDNDDQGRYSRDRVMGSQRKMHEALRHVEASLGALRRSDGTYDETNEAVRDLRRAAELTRRCVGEYRR